MAKRLDHPPFPRLTWDEVEWTARVVVPAFSATRKTDLVVRTTADDDGEDEPDPIPPTAEQAAAYAFLSANDAAVRDAALAGVLRYVTELSPSYPPWAKAVESAAADPAWLGKSVRLATVFVYTAAAEGVAYTGFEFGCRWDEGGVAVVAHRSRVVHVGPGEDASDDTPAAKDARRSARRPRGPGAS